MPGIITHHLCGEAVYGGMEEPLKNIITKNRGLYNVGAQGPDVFFYYVPAYVSKRFRNIGSHMHSSGFARFFSSAASSAKEAGGREKDALTAYLCGYLTHYALDTETHPYIYYKTGFLKPGESGTGARYLAYHRNFETSIDVLMLKLICGNKPADRKLWRLIRVSPSEAELISGVITSSINSAYSTSITGTELRQAINSMKRVTRFIQSYKGRRKRVFETIEKAVIGESIISSLIHMQDANDDLDYLNLKKKIWLMPWDDKQNSNASFTELFERAIKSAAVMAEGLFSFMRGSISLGELLHITGDKSFSSGIDSSSKVIFNFRDIIYDNRSNRNSRL